MSKENLQELKQLAEMLQLEKEEDQEQYKIQVQTKPLHERVQEGFSWYPLEIVKTGYTIGERAYVLVQKNSAAQHNQFRSGNSVNFFSQAPHVHRPEYTGVINYVDKNRMKIVLNSKDLPEWLNLGQIGVDLLFDERTYVEMEKALRRVTEASRDRLSELRNIFYGIQEPVFSVNQHPVEEPELNASQNAAVNKILSAQDVAVVHGPPGTGKTTTLVHAIKLLCQRENTVLVTAPSNTATDLLTERLFDKGLLVVRIGNISRVDEHIIRHTLEAQLSAHPEAKMIKKVRIEAAAARQNARKFKRHFGAEERAEREQYKNEARELEAWANQIEERLIDQILSSAQVITCTLVGSSNSVLDKRKFQTVVIDEAAQALEPATWIPISKAQKVVLAGDPFQLPPTVKSQKAMRGGLNITLLEKCLQRLPEVCLLNVQYRMHAAIMGFSNSQFYNNALQTADLVVHRPALFVTQPVVFIDTAGCGFEELVNEEYQSRSNPDEFGILREHLYQLIEIIGDQPFPSIALISPYREQVLYMKQAVAEDALLSTLPIDINTIDAFQGQERDVIYLSLVRSNTKSEIGFLADYRRMNVAMTRARYKLIVVGDSATIGGHRFYEAFLNYCEKEGGYRSAWEYFR